MDLNRKTTLFLVSTSLLLGVCISINQIESAWMSNRKAEIANLTQAEDKVLTLRRNIEQYEKSKAVVAGGDGLTKHEKVVIASSFTAAELPKIPQFLTQAYEKDGFLLLKNFDLSWTETANGSPESSGTAKLELKLMGEKVFLH